MHIHVPKPLKTWREFVGEIGIIVIGILLALGAEQIIERYHWLHEVDAARDALRVDYIDVLTSVRERQAEDGCIRRRLNELLAVVDGGGPVLRAIGPIGAPALRTWESGSWPSAVSSQIATHFPREEMLTIAGLQSSGRDAATANARELEDWAALYTMVGHGRRFASDEAATMRRSIADATYRANLLRLSVFQIEHFVLTANLLTPADLREVDRGLAYVLTGPNRRSLCAPLRATGSDGISAPYDPVEQVDPVAAVIPPKAATSVTGTPIRP